MALVAYIVQGATKMTTIYHTVDLDLFCGGKGIRTPDHLHAMRSFSDRRRSLAAAILGF